MDPKKKPLNDIASALDKVDKEVAKIQHEKYLENKRQKKMAPPVVKEIDRAEVLKQQNLEDQKNIISGIKSKSILVGLIFLSTILLTYTISKEERVNLIEQVIFLFLFCGIVASAAAKK